MDFQYLPRHPCAGNTKHVKTSSYTPSSNRKLERFHSFLMAGVRKLAYHDVMCWDVYLPEVLWAYRGDARTHRVVPFLPYQRL